MTLTAGQAAPDFVLPDADLTAVSLSEYRGRCCVVLYFYPKDGTKGCTLEGLEFTDLQERFAARDTVVLGVSRDNCMSHAAFRDEHGLSVRLLADVDGEVCRRYGVWQEREIDGFRREGIVRSTFVIDRQGIIRHALYGVIANGHARKVLDLIEAMAPC